MENVTITFNTILQLFGALAVVGGGVKIIIGMFAPYRAIKAEIEKIMSFLAKDKQRLEDGEERMEDLSKRIDKINDGLSVLGLAVSEMINHQVTGNDTEELKKHQKTLNEYFYKRKEVDNG